MYDYNLSLFLMVNDKDSTFESDAYKQQEKENMENYDVIRKLNISFLSIVT